MLESFYFLSVVTRTSLIPSVVLYLDLENLSLAQDNLLLLSDSVERLGIVN